jgi:hypothetical protein
MTRSRLAVGVVCVMLAASFAAAQGAAGGEKKEILATGGLISSLVAAPVIGQPYSAVQVHHTSRKLADGTTISQKGHHFVARDAQGRVRVRCGWRRGKMASRIR